MTALYTVPPVERFAALVNPETQILFHGLNKSGSMAMAMVMRDAFAAAERSDEFCCHYFQGGSLESFVGKVDARDGRAFFLGHSLYGAVAPRPNRALVTQFRHPLPRVLSCYNWLKNKHVKAGNPEPYPPLDEWVERSKGKAHSQIIHFGLGYGRLAPHRRKRMTNRDIFETAIDAIERECLCFGIAEYFEESIFLVAALAGLPAVPPWVRDQRNPGRPLSSEIPAASRQLIEEVYKYDFRLYDYALGEFRKTVAAVGFGDAITEYKTVCSKQYNDRVLV